MEEGHCDIGSFGQSSGFDASSSKRTSQSSLEREILERVGQVVLDNNCNERSYGRLQDKTSLSNNRNLTTHVLVFCISHLEIVIDEWSQSSAGMLE